MIGVWFGNKHSWQDFNLNLSDVDISLPEVDYKLLEVPGMDGVVDQTEALDGETHYKNRTLTLTFTYAAMPSRYHAKRQELANYLHGRRFKIILDSDSDYYYEGRCQVDSFKSSVITATIVVSCNVYPYKLRRITTAVEAALTTQYKTITLHNERRTVIPTITVDYATTVKYNGFTYSLKAGSSRILDLQLHEGITVIDAKLNSAQSGKIKIEYQEASF